MCSLPAAHFMRAAELEAESPSAPSPHGCPVRLRAWPCYALSRYRNLLNTQPKLNCCCTSLVSDILGSEASNEFSLVQLYVPNKPYCVCPFFVSFSSCYSPSQTPPLHPPDDRCPDDEVGGRREARHAPTPSHTPNSLSVPGSPRYSFHPLILPHTLPDFQYSANIYRPIHFSL